MLTPLDSVVTIVTKDWAPAVAVFCDGMRAYASKLCKRIIIYRTEPLGDVELWASRRDPRVEFRPIEALGDPPEPWPARNDFERLCYNKLTLLSAEWLGERIAWIDVDILCRHPIDDLAELYDYTAPPAWGSKAPAMHIGPALSFGLVIFEPSLSRVNHILNYSLKIEPDANARDQNLVSRYMWAEESERINNLSLEYHINTRCKHYQPELWERIGTKRLYHYGGPKPWEKTARRQIYKPWRELFNEWIDTYNDLDVGAPVERFRLD